MNTQKTLVTLTLAAVTATALSTASFAQDGHAPMPMFPFDTVDADKDGKVTQAELDTFRAAEAVAMDTDADGKLTAEELTAAHLARMTKRVTAMAAEMVERLDTDGDKALSAVELAARPMPALLFEKADADGDGAVTKPEAEALRDKLAERMDERPGKGRRGQHWGWGLMGDN